MVEINSVGRRPGKSTVGGYHQSMDAFNKGMSQVIEKSRREIMNKEINKEQIQSQFQEIEYTPKTLEQFNINTGYLLTILRLIDEYSIIKVNGMNNNGKNNPEYYYQLFEVLEMILDMIYCKMTLENQKGFQKRLDYVQSMIEEIFIETDDNMLMDKIQSLKLRREISLIFRDLLFNMEERGMLTYKTDDPKFAMGKFSD